MKIKNKIHFDKFKIFLIGVILLSITGILTIIIDKTLINIFKIPMDEYLDRAYSESKKLLITLSLMKGATDVIEGSTLNLNSIIGMDVEIGDLISPIHDTINILWKISLISTVILKIETLYYEIFKAKVANMLILISVISYLPTLFYFSKPMKLLKKISKYILMVVIFIYAVIPSSILISSKISEYFENEYQKPAIENLNKDFDSLNKSKDQLFKIDQEKSIFNIPGQFESTKEKINNLTEEIKIVSKSLVEYSPIIICIILLSYMIIPALLMFFLYKLIKIIFFDKMLK